MQEIKSKNAVIYTRVSTREQVEEGNSLVTQEKFCREYALKHGYTVVQVFVESGESAKTADRTQLKKLLDFCSNRKNNIGVVIAYKIDRISRNMDDYSSIRILLKRYGVQIKSTSEHFETTTPAGRFMENIIANVAQFDNDVRTERSVNGMRDAMKEGRYVWIAPLGYANVRIAGKATISHDNHAPLILEAFKRIAANTCPLAEVRRQMNERGLRSKAGKPISQAQFYRTVRNPLYAGWIMKFGQKQRGVYEPIVSDELFEQVQLVINRGTPKNYLWKRENPDFPLRRFVHNENGGKLTGAWSQGNRRKYAYYLFRNPTVSIPKDELETAFIAFMNRFALSPKYFKNLVKLVQEHIDQKLTTQKDEKRKLEAKLTELEARQTALLQKNFSGVISDMVLQQQLEIIEKETTSINSLLYQMPDTGIHYKTLIEDLREYFISPGNTWAKAPFICKLKLQWFDFPKGITLTFAKDRTRKITSIFKAKTAFLERFSRSVSFIDQNTNTPQIDNPEEYEKQLLELKLGIKQLHQIKQQIDAGGAETTQSPKDEDYSSLSYT